MQRHGALKENPHRKALSKSKTPQPQILFSEFPSKMFLTKLKLLNASYLICSNRLLSFLVVEVSNWCTVYSIVYGTVQVYSVQLWRSVTGVVR